MTARNGSEKDALESDIFPEKAEKCSRKVDWCEFIWGQAIQGLQLSRSHPYRKNDNRLVEQKNFSLVRKYGKKIKKNLAPHDMRRTFAQLGYSAGIPLVQMSILLGHSNVKVTQTYLNLELNLETTASDFIPLAE